MSDRHIDITVGSKYDGSGLKMAAADLAKLREKLALPSMGPLTRGQQMQENNAIRRAGGRSNDDIYRFGPTQQNRADDLLRDLQGLRGQGSDVSRLRGGNDPKGSEIVKAKQDLLKSLHQEKERYEKILKLAGGIGVAEYFGQGLQKVPETLDKFDTDIKSGATKTQAFASALADTIPGIGTLANGLRAAYDALSKTADERKEQRDREDQQDLREIRGKQTDTRNAARQPILLEGREVGRKASDDLSLARTEGRARQRAETEAAYEAEKRRLTDLKVKRSGLSEDQQTQLDAQVAEGMRAAAAAREDKLKEINKQADTEREAAQREHYDRMSSISDDANRTELERQGKFLTAKERDIDAAMRKEIVAAKRAAEDAKKNPDVDPVLANERAEKEVAAIRARGTAQRAALREQEQREVQDSEQSHRDKLLGGEADLAERRLRMSGQNVEADKLAAKRGYEQRLEEIKSGLEQEVKAHKEREPELRKQAAEDARAAGESYNLSLEEVQQRQAESYRPAGPRDIQGDVKLLTGVGASISPQSPMERAAKAAEESKKTGDRVAKGIETLVAYFTGSGPAVQTMR